MYNVSEEYLKVISKPVRTWKIRVEFSFSDRTRKVFDDSTIIGDPMIESQAVSGSSSCGMIDIGAAPCATASLTVIDEGATLRKYAEAEFTMWVSLLLESGRYEDVLMGTFYCDTSKMSRTGSQINVYAYDAMSTLNYTLTEAQREELDFCTPYQVVTALVKNAKCKFNQYFSFPNQANKIDLSSTQVRTARDCIMWCAQMLGCFVRINRQNYLEFVPIRSTWEYFNEDRTLGTIIAVRNISQDERYNTTFSDDRIHIVGVSMPDDNNNLITKSIRGLEDDSNVIIAMERNPLFMSSQYSLEYALNSILVQLSTTYFYAFNATIRSDPALDAGDTVRLTGGLINGTNQNNDLIGFITHNIWRYRGKHEIINTGQTPTPSVDGITYDTPRSQSDKLLESLNSKTNKLDEQVEGILKGVINPGAKEDRLISGNGYYRYQSGTISYTDEYTEGGTIKSITTSGYAALLTHNRDNAECSRITSSNILFSAQDVNGTAYKLSLGTPLTQFFDYKHGTGFKFYYHVGSAADLYNNADRLEIGFGEDNGNLTLSKSGTTLGLSGIDYIYIDGVLVWSKDTAAYSAAQPQPVAAKTTEEGEVWTYEEDGIHVSYKGHTKVFPWDE